MEYEYHHHQILCHPFFRRLPEEVKNSFRDYYFIQDYLRGEKIVFAGDVLESLYLVLEGRVGRHNEEGLADSYFEGDVWGIDCLWISEKTASSFIALEDCVILRLRSDGFRRLLRDFPAAKQSFRTEANKEGQLLSGFPSEAWDRLKHIRPEKEGMIHYKGRSSKKSFSLFLLIPALLIAAGFLLLPRSPWFALLLAGGLLVLFCELFLRKMSLYKVRDKSAQRRFFDWRSFRVEQDELPLDQVKSVQVNVKGPIRKILKIGDLLIQTPGRSLVFKGIDRPESLQKLLLDLRDSRQSENEGRYKEDFRNLVRQKLFKEREQPYEGRQCHPELKSDVQIFRKSPAVLFFLCILPFGFLVLSFLAGTLEFPAWGKAALWLCRGGLAFRLLWLVIDWWNDIYKIELPYIWDIERKPFASREEKIQCDLSGILNVRVIQRGLIRMLFNYGDIVIDTPGESGTLTYFSVSNPFQVQTEIFRYRDELLKRKEAEQQKQAMERFGEYSEILKQVTPIAAERKHA